MYGSSGLLWGLVKVEHLVMKAMCEKLIIGKIDEAVYPAAPGQGSEPRAPLKPFNREK